MVKNGVKKTETVEHKIRKILITQPKPDTDKSPYFELARKYNVQLEFHPFIRLDGIPSKEFRKQKVEISQYTAVIFTSRNAIDHFFRICEEMKISISQDTKYFCITEAVALYLQKFILYRKRKVFYGADGSNKSMLDVINKHKENEKFLYPSSENQQDNEIVSWLKAHNCEFATPFMYRTISNNVKDLFADSEYDIICFFTPSGVRSLLENFPSYKQNGTRIGAFGNNTSKAITEAGLTLEIKAPQPQAPSMVAALEQYLATVFKKK
ncbi:MAG: uroporphyrinogen-III synthase [Chitinophagaceae bacterium]|nr:MAG: uroporphyrinogen-III synthase [Chitinophagaceae bacterium]